MAIGPLESFVFPGVLVKTINDNTGASAAGDIRFPAFIGVSAEEIRVSSFEMVRGSSAIADNIILDENVSSQFTGANSNFTVANFPIVTGNGTGKVATSPSNVIVTVNGNNVPVNAVNGLTGEVILVGIPKTTDDVRVNYYFKRRDTYIVDEDLSAQADASNVTFKVHSQRIVKGDNSGRSATDADINGTVTILYNPDPNVPGDEFERTVRVLDVRVNGALATVSDLDGANGLVRLATAPGATDQVLVTYFTNNWQDTYDILPAEIVNRVVKVGLSQDTSDFSIGTDCVLSGQNRLHWGQSHQEEMGLYTAGSTPLVDNVIVSLSDTKVYGIVAEPVSPFIIATVPDTDTDGNILNDGTNLQFDLPTYPVDGTGAGTLTEDPSLLTAYVGTTWATAVARDILSVNGTTVTLKGPAPTHSAPGVGEKVFVTYFENLLVDDSWVMTNRVPGGVGAGKYTISSLLHGNALDVVQTGGTGSPVYAGAGTPNMAVSPISGSVERVTIEFIDGSGTFEVTSKLGTGFTVDGRTGSVTTLNKNIGQTGKTYIDPTTGFRVTFTDDTGAWSPVLGETIVYDIGDPTQSDATKKLYITAQSDIVRVLPGINLTVASTDGVAEDNTGDTVNIYTYNKSGNEPEIGDVYYVTFDKNKTDYSVKFLTNMRDVFKYYGPIDINNKLTIAANLAFQNGAQAVALKQVVRTVGGTDASIQDYIDGIDAFNEPLPNGLNPSLIQPLSTDAQIHSYLKSSNAIQCSIRYRNERTSVIGFAVGVTSDEVIQRVKNLASEKITAIYPDGAIIGITDAYGNEVEYIVDGSMIAAAVAGRDVSSVTDIATTLTNSTITGFKRLYRRLDNVTAGLVANAGCTVLEEQTPVIRILFYLTTDVSTALTRDPRIVEVKHYIQQGLRKNLNRYIGSKNLPKMQPQIKDAVGAYFSQLKRNEIIVNFTGISVTQNASDPSTLDVEAAYSPVFPLNWIMVTLNLRQSV